MKKNKIIQFSLVIVGIILLFFTYHTSNKDKIVDIDENNVIGNVGLNQDYGFKKRKLYKSRQTGNVDCLIGGSMFLIGRRCFSAG